MDSNSAISCSIGTIVVAVSSDRAGPSAGFHTMVAPLSSPEVSVPLSISRSVAAFDSVSGRSKLSL